jgi:transcriptional regulator with XRE-family HTH domain
MYTSDENIIQLIDLLKYQKKISSTKDFCKEIGVLEQTVSKVKKGLNHFTVLHIEIICKKYNVNSNWIFGIQKNIFNLPEPKQIKELA